MQNTPRTPLDALEIRRLGTLNGNNTSVTMNIFKVIGSVEILTAHGEVMDVTTLTNMTAVYTDLWDGTTAVNITANGAILSGAPVGSLIIKQKDSTNAMITVLANQARVTEPANDKKTHQPFIVTQKNGVDTYIRMNYTTTDAPIDAQILFIVKYRPIDGGSITLA
ncbi:MAG: hypothetical protein U9O94_05110 [Nanoarchaeota archaeon]|nr:hypothetical protein [Nanoarchaeota archaeon]